MMEENKEQSEEENWLEDEEGLVAGQYVLVGTDPIPTGKPTWFDPVKYKDGQQCVTKYFGAIFYSHLISLLLMLFSPQALKTLIFSQKSDTPAKAYRRYISTTAHIMSWYRGDVWTSGTASRTSLERVRGYHAHMAASTNDPCNRLVINRAEIPEGVRALDRGKPLLEQIRMDLETIPDWPKDMRMASSYREMGEAASDCRVPFLNQTDMAVTQFAFVGLLILQPHKFGAARATDRELEGFIHMWRCYGYFLGIQDRFNFCQPDNLVQMRRRANYWLRRIVLPGFKSSVSAQYEHMARAVALGARGFMRNSTFESQLLYAAWVVDLAMPNVERSVAAADRRAFRFRVWFFSVAANWLGANRVLNFFVDLAVRLCLCPPKYWPFKYRPPLVPGLGHLWLSPT